METSSVAHSITSETSYASNIHSPQRSEDGDAHNNDTADVLSEGGNDSSSSDQSLQIKYELSIVENNDNDDSYPNSSHSENASETSSDNQVEDVLLSSSSSEKWDEDLADDQELYDASYLDDIEAVLIVEDTHENIEHREEKLELLSEYSSSSSNEDEERNDISTLDPMNQDLFDRSDNDVVERKIFNEIVEEFTQEIQKFVEVVPSSQEIDRMDPDELMEYELSDTEGDYEGDEEDNVIRELPLTSDEEKEIKIETAEQMKEKDEDAIDEKSEEDEDFVDEKSEDEEDIVDEKNVVDEEGEEEEDFVDEKSVVDEEGEEEKDIVDEKGEEDEDIVDEEGEEEEDIVDEESEDEEDIVDEKSVGVEQKNEKDADLLEEMREMEEDVIVEKSEDEEDFVEENSEKDKEEKSEEGEHLVDQISENDDYRSQPIAAKEQGIEELAESLELRDLISAVIGETDIDLDAFSNSEAEDYIPATSEDILQELSRQEAIKQSPIGEPCFVDDNNVQLEEVSIQVHLSRIKTYSQSRLKWWNNLKISLFASQKVFQKQKN